MVIGLFGFNGSGKTITMVREAGNYNTVFCNFKLQAQPHQKVLYDVLANDLLAKLRYYTSTREVDPVTGCFVHPERIALCIDEGGLNFPARSWKQLTSVEAGLFAQSRKLGIDFLYTCQHFRMVDSILRNNTAFSGYPSHFFGMGWCKWYEGFEKKKEMMQYVTVYWLPAYYRRYRTMEIVESTKFYFANDDKDPPDLNFEYGTGARVLPAVVPEADARSVNGVARPEGTTLESDKESVA